MKELLEGVRCLEAAEVGDGGNVQCRVFEQFLGLVEPHGLYLVEHGATGNLAEAYLRHAPRALEGGGDFGGRDALACASPDQLHRRSRE